MKVTLGVPRGFNADAADGGGAHVRIYARGLGLPGPSSLCRGGALLACVRWAPEVQEVWRFNVGVGLSLKL